MLLKGFALILLIIIPVLLYSVQKKQLYSPPWVQSSLSPSPSPAAQPGTPEVTLPTDTPAILNENTVLPSPTVQIDPTSMQKIDTSIASFLYPQSTILTQDATTFSLVSTDGANQITDWYKHTISANSMNTTSFITSQTNDTVSNKLVASKAGEDISIEIQKDSGSSQVRIKGSVLFH